MPKTRRGDPGYFAYVSEPAWFYFPRFGKDDRRHGVPNPVAHLLLSRLLADNYVDLRKRARASKLTLSPPIFDWSGTRALMRSSVESRDDFRLNLSSRREEYVSADVRAFFHSIYTHAIPWAVHGKATAKRNRGWTLYGNVIDLLVRNAQDGQTVGIPVGPDTSRLLAEVLASAIDEHLQQRLGIGSRDSSRYIDDYTLSSPDNGTGEELLAATRQAAALYELELNSDKSGIFPTSHRQNSGWQQAARAHLPRVAPGERVETAMLQHFLYQLGRVCIDHPDVNVEKYGLQHARSALVNASDWNALLFSLINAYRRNPTVVSLLVEACLLRQAAFRDVSKENLTEFIEGRIPVLARENRTGEIVWLLFLAIRLGLTLPANRLSPLFLIENALVALLVVCMDARGLVAGTVDRSTWDQSLTREGLRGPMWLYCYEAVAGGLISVSDDFITQDPYFSLLHSKHVSFLDVERGYDSIALTLRLLRSQNERLHRLRNAILDDDVEELDDLDEGEDDDMYGPSSLY